MSAKMQTKNFTALLVEARLTLKDFMLHFSKFSPNTALNNSNPRSAETIKY
jgi:hypothetical protein